MLLGGGGDVKCIDPNVDFGLVKEDKALWPCLLACLSQTHFLTSCLAKCFSAGEITVSMESDFMELEEKADGKREDEKRFKERWIEMILLRWYTYNRHELYLWLDCFFWRRMRKVPSQYNTDIHSASYAWNLKAFSSFCLCSSLQMCCGLPTISPPPPPPGQIQWQRKTALPTALVTTELTKTDLFHCWTTQAFLHFFCLLANLCSSANHHGLFPGICLSSGSSDLCCPTWACPGRIWHHTGPHGPWCRTISQCLWRCALISTPRD